jgi:hypothetical protein
MKRTHRKISLALTLCSIAVILGRSAVYSSKYQFGEAIYTLSDIVAVIMGLILSADTLFSPRSSIWYPAMSELQIKASGMFVFILCLGLLIILGYKLLSG